MGAALTALIDRDLAALLKIFDAQHFATAPQGLVDFMYALGDSSASAIQYGRPSPPADAHRASW